MMAFSADMIAQAPADMDAAAPAAQAGPGQTAALDLPEALQMARLRLALASEGDARALADLNVHLGSGVVSRLAAPGEIGAARGHWQGVVEALTVHLILTDHAIPAPQPQPRPFTPAETEFLGALRLVLPGCA